MGITAEQRFLKALIKFHMSETSGTETEQKAFKDACEEYLDQFRDVKEKVDQFTDVSKKVENLHICFFCNGTKKIQLKFPAEAESDCPFCRNEMEVKPEWKPEVGKLYKRDCGTIYEHMGMIGKYALFRALDGSESKAYPSNNIPLTSIAELEGLEVGDSVYGIAYQKYTHPWHITGITGSLIFVKKHGESAILTLNKRGFSYEIGSTQLFWRTADRAERFGRGDA